MVPKLQLSQPWRRETQEHRWQRVTLQVNMFTEEEVPQVSPLPFRSFAIGEEQSFSHVVGLAWSPEGLAKHQRCALAVLTANHVLSVWASGSNPNYQRSWERVLVVNHALRQAFNAVGSQDDVGEEQADEFSRLGCRIRAFSWAPSLPDSRSSDYEFARDSIRPFRHHLLAVSNDLGQLIFIGVESPFRYMKWAGKPWSAKVITHRDTCGIPLDPAQLKGPDDPIIIPENFVSDISWSSLNQVVQDDGEARIIFVAYVRASRLNILVCRVDTHTTEIKLQLLQEKRDFDGEYLGTLDWTSQVSKARMSCLHLWNLM